MVENLARSGWRRIHCVRGDRPLELTNDEKPLEKQLANVGFSWHHALLPVYLIKGRRLRRPIIHVVGWRREWPYPAYRSRHVNKRT